MLMCLEETLCDVCSGQVWAGLYQPSAWSTHQQSHSVFLDRTAGHQGHRRVPLGQPGWVSKCGYVYQLGQVPARSVKPHCCFLQETTVDHQLHTRVLQCLLYVVVYYYYVVCGSSEILMFTIEYLQSQCLVILIKYKCINLLSAHLKSTKWSKCSLAKYKNVYGHL